MRNNPPKFRINASTAELLKQLADKYETESFIPVDPVRYPHMFTDQANIEIVGFIASWLAYGKREHFMHVIEKLLHDIKQTGLTPYEFVIQQKAHVIYKDIEFNCLYRFYKYQDFILLCDALRKIYTNYPTLEHAMLDRQQTLAKKGMKWDYPLVEMLVYIFKPYHIAGIPITTKSACKKLNMFLRWMIRKNSPVDLGIWEHFDPIDLIIPLDTHAARIGRKLGFITRNSDDLKTALELTTNCMDVFRTDPTRADFALFGYGVNEHTIEASYRIENFLKI